MTAYKTFGDFNLTEGSVLIKRFEGEGSPYYDVIGIFPRNFEEDNLRFVFIKGILYHDEIDDYLDESLLKYVGRESIDDYKDDYEKIYDIVSYDGLSVFYEPNPFVSYEELLEQLKYIDIEGVEGVDYSLELLD